MSRPKAPGPKRLSAAARREVIKNAATELFAERGYQHSSMGEIARRSGVTPPVVYDHFASKKDLHRQLLDSHYAGLRGVWADNMDPALPTAERLGRSFAAWFAYLEAHPFVAKFLFRDASGDPEIQAVHDEVAAASRQALLPLLVREPAAAQMAGTDDIALDMLWETLRSVLQGLALWWSDHPDVPREAVVSTAMNAVWIGLERVQAGEQWQIPRGVHDGVPES